MGALLDDDDSLSPGIGTERWNDLYYISVITLLSTNAYVFILQQEVIATNL